MELMQDLPRAVDEIARGALTRRLVEEHRAHPLMREDVLDDGAIALEERLDQEPVTSGVEGVAMTFEFGRAVRADPREGGELHRPPRLVHHEEAEVDVAPVLVRAMAADVAPLAGAELGHREARARHHPVDVQGDGLDELDQCAATEVALLGCALEVA
jgi:hypothetical protein